MLVAEMGNRLNCDPLARRGGARCVNSPRVPQLERVAGNASSAGQC
jgi:hypothetical protein